jgi:hypothetical protein
VLSRPDVLERLRDGFIGLRLDWEQGNHYREKFGFILGTGDQMLLDPAGNPIAHREGGAEGRRSLIHGRHGRDTTAAVLDEVTARFPPGAGPLELEIEWFLWPSHPSRGGKGRYPVPHEAIAGFARMPLAVIDGPMPAALEDSAFLRRHVRQFIWVRGKTEGPGRITIRRVRDGLRQGLSTELAAIDPSAVDREALGQALDAAWLEYMKDRPLTARGYLENPHGKWMRGQRDRMLGEEEAVRTRARAGTLLPPGRAAPRDF